MTRVRALKGADGPLVSKVSRVRGFTLIELLVVMAVMGIIMTLALPAMNTIFRGNKLSQGMQTVVDRLNLARQTAITRNIPVQVRFYKYADPTVPGASVSFRGLQALQMVTANTLVPLEKVQALPTAIIIDSSTTLSSLLDSTKRPLSSGTNLVPGIAGSVSYITLLFHPDGSTDLLPTSGLWFLTLHDAIRGDGLSTPPTNFVTIQIDPTSGSLEFFRPGF